MNDITTSTSEVVSRCDFFPAPCEELQLGFKGELTMSENMEPQLDREFLCTKNNEKNTAAV